MHILVTSATLAEIKPFSTWLQQNKLFTLHEINLLITGVGCVQTTYMLTKEIANTKPDLVLQAGIAGSFPSGPTPGSVVGVKEDLFGDVGVEENNKWRDLFDLGLALGDNPPFANRLLINNSSGRFRTISSWVRAITVNEVTTSEKRMNMLTEKYNPAVETMEGAAFHFVCLQEDVQFLQLRSISNTIGERDKSKWAIEEAIDALNRSVISIIQHTGI
ncbi:MAG TPA: futalosine hydrolase [Flavitalea sp.]|nr:futalosine hydrolase [Flavitalea sp.]